jgi:Spy/CpxP family protein refolding chaperone
MRWKPLATVFLIAFVAALAGGFIGRALAPAPAPKTNAMHAFLHKEIKLDADQHAKIHVLERQFAGRRQELEGQLRAENLQLAKAIEAEHGDGPRVRAAIQAFHQTMSQLQTETIAHVFAMRAVLRPDQAAKFDRAVSKALTGSDD